MKCQFCGYEYIPEGSRNCPNCGEEIPKSSKAPTQIDIEVTAGRIEGGKLKGAEIGEVIGDASIESTVNQIETNIAQGDYVSRDVITNNILVLGNGDALDAILRKLMDSQGVDEGTLRNLGALVVPENVSDQITELIAAQKEVEAKGISASPQAMYRLGMLAAYRREYDSSLAYFRQSAQADPEYSEAFEAISWLQQSLAMSDIQKRNYEDAIVKLADARAASSQTDPLDPQALALRGYISKTLAQIANARKNVIDRQKYYEEAAKLFAHAIKLDPDNASAHNGLGNVEYALGNIDSAIAAYDSAIELAPAYTAAHHDLALAFQSKMESDTDNAVSWCQKALGSLRRAYKLAPDDPGFNADKILKIGQWISWLEQQCG